MNLTKLLKPKSVAVIGASVKKKVLAEMYAVTLSAMWKI